MALSLSIRLGLAGTNGVSIIGSAQVGAILSLSAIYLEGDGPDLTYRAQWLSVAATGVQTPIQGAVGATYVVGYAQAGLGIRAMVETPTGEIIYSQIVNIPVTQPAPLDALAVTVAPHPTNPALIRIIYNGPLPPNGGSPITAVRRERFVGGVSQGVYHLRVGGALPVVGGVYDVPGETGVDNTVFVYAENATSGTPNKGTPHIVVPGSATQAPGAVALLTVTPSDGQNTVTFAAPATGGAAVDYLVEVTTDGTTYATVTTILAAGPLAHTHTGLTNGTAYTYRVTARNSGGSGLATTASGTPAAPAVAPTITAEASVTAADLGASIRYTFTNPTATGTDPIDVSISAATLDGVDVLGSFSGLSIEVIKTALDQALAVTFLASNTAGSASSTVSVTVPAAVSSATVTITEAASDRFQIAPSEAGTLTIPLAGTTTAADDADIEIRLVERFRRDTLTSLFASTREAVLALKDDLTTNGVGAAALRPVSALAGTAGLTINTAAKTVTVAAGALVMVSYVNFDGWKIIGNAGSHFVPIYCLIGNPGNGALAGGKFFAVDLYPGSVVTGVPGARIDAHFCSFESSGSGSNALQTLIKVRVNDNGVSVAPTTNLHHCRLAGYTSDSFKPVRGRIEFCYFDPAVTSPGAHADLVTVPACDPAIGVQFRACYFNQDSAARGAGYTGFPAVADGVNNVLRLGPGTSTIAQTAFGQVLVSECIFERDPNTVSKSFQFVEAAGVTVTAPRFVNNKWIKDDASASRWYAGETTAIEWGNNLTPADATTSPPAAGTSVTAPAYTDPADWADIDIRSIIDWTPAGVALSSAWTASLTFPTTPFDVVVSARVAGSASIDTAAYTYIAGSSTPVYFPMVIQGQSGAKYSFTMQTGGGFNVGGVTRPTISGALGSIVEMDGAEPGGYVEKSVNNTNFQTASGGFIVSRGGYAVCEFAKFLDPAKEPVLVVLAKPGQSMATLVNDDNAGWDWAEYETALDYVTTTYGPIKLLLTYWYGSAPIHIDPATWMAELANGTKHILGNKLDNTSGEPGVDHYLFDVNPTGASLGAYPYPAGPKLEYVLAPNSSQDPAMRAAIKAFFEDPRLSSLNLGQHTVGMSGHADDSIDPVPFHAMMVMGAGILKAMGATVLTPTITDMAAAPDGSYIDVTVDLPNGGNLTTIRAQNGIADPGSPDPLYLPVFGFEFATPAQADSARASLPRATWSAAITNSGTGTAPTRTGTVRLTPTTAIADNSRLSYRMGGTGTADAASDVAQAQMAFFNYLIEEVPAWRQSGVQWPFPGIEVAPTDTMTMLPLSGVPQQPLTTSGVTSGTTAAIPSGAQVGDLLVAIADRSQASLPGAAAGWTDVGTWTGLSSQASFRVATRVYQAGDAAPVFTNADNVEIMRFGSGHTVGSVAFDGAVLGEYIQLPALTLTGSSAWEIMALRSRHGSQTGWGASSLTGWTRTTSAVQARQTFVRNGTQTSMPSVNSPAVISGSANGGAGLHIEIVRP